VRSLPGNTKTQGIDKIVAFGVRLAHSWAAMESPDYFSKNFVFLSKVKIAFIIARKEIM